MHRPYTPHETRFREKQLAFSWSEMSLPSLGCQVTSLDLLLRLVRHCSYLQRLCPVGTYSNICSCLWVWQMSKMTLACRGWSWDVLPNIQRSSVQSYISECPQCPDWCWGKLGNFWRPLKGSCESVMKSLEEALQSQGPKCAWRDWR